MPFVCRHFASDDDDDRHDHHDGRAGVQSVAHLQGIKMMMLRYHRMRARRWRAWPQCGRRRPNDVAAEWIVFMLGNLMMVLTIYSQGGTTALSMSASWAAFSSISPPSSIS